MIPDFSRFIYNGCKKGHCTDNDICRMAAFLVQDGKCYVSGVPLLENHRHLHHRLPRQHGGEDTSDNLVYLDSTIHLMVHTDDFSLFCELLRKVCLNERQLHLLNQLRHEAHNKPMGM